MHIKDFLAEEEKQKEKYMLAVESDKVVISQDNVARVFAMMSNSPQYKKADNKENKGSSSYWFTQWKESGTIKKSDLWTLLKLLNAENSTHVSDQDMKKIRNNIFRHNGELISLLKEPNYTIIETIINDCFEIRFSFATKFCHYACLYLLSGKARDNFPIFDDIMRQNLGAYSTKWNETKINRKLRRNYSYREIIQSEGGLAGFYQFYVECIEEVAKAHEVSKTGVEQLIWYYHNGG